MINKFNKTIIYAGIGLLFILLSIIVLVLLGIFLPNNLLLEPLVTPSEYLNSIPYWTIGDTIIIVPSSTIFVYILGAITILLGISFLKQKREVSYWWSISMIFWGLGAILAGTSYQGLGYELKCSGEVYCSFTSWFELSYLYVTAMSIAALAVAIAKSILPIDKQKPLLYYAIISSIVYPIILVLGSVLEIRFLISYELFTIFFMPLFIVFFVYSIINYRKQKDELNRTLIITWILFLAVNVSYYVYFYLGFTESLYDNFGIWFSANDVLHVLLIIWMIYLWRKVKPLIIEATS